MMNGMETILVASIIAVFGLLFGSFAGAQVWRLRARQLRDEDARLVVLQNQNKLSEDDKEEKRYLLEEAKDRKEQRTRLNGLIQGVSEDYSRCLGCGHRLAWFDLLPLVSWLSTSGKCRYCKTPIGIFEPLMEIGVAAAFSVSYLLWPWPLVDVFSVTLFALWLTSIVLLAILFAYDVKWFLLPDIITFPLIVVAALMAGLRAVRVDDVLVYGLDVLFAILALSGLYFLLWFMSKGRWVGFGDVKLGLGLALLLADWRLALLTLFLANFIGTLIVLPAMALGKLHRGAQVPFGPLLIAGMFIAMLIGTQLIGLYVNTLF